MQITDTQFQELEDKVQSIEASFKSVSEETKKSTEKIRERDNFQLVEPLDPFTARSIYNQITIPITVVYPGTTPATATNFNNYFIANRSYIIEAIVINYGTASTSGTFKVVKTASGTAVASGTDVMTTTISMSATANTNYTASLKTDASITLKSGDRLGIIVAGTLTNQANLVVTTNLRQI